MKQRYCVFVYFLSINGVLAANARLINIIYFIQYTLYTFIHNKNSHKIEHTERNDKCKDFAEISFPILISLSTYTFRGFKQNDQKNEFFFVSEKYFLFLIKGSDSAQNKF